ncbi:MAG: hypothetical protein ACRCZI_14105, partial [Cetobacterium sp.]
ATVVSRLSTHVYGIPELVVGLHAKKILTALDMFDWEESGASMKADVKMKDIPASHFEKSLLTWLPQGHKSTFHELMESLGSVLSDTKCGAWGKMKNSVDRAFKGKEKQTLLSFIEQIRDFYKITSTGNNGTRSHHNRC